jgi:hypothetical protein
VEQPSFAAARAAVKLFTVVVSCCICFCASTRSR